jgi:hypothetical protein
MSEIFDIITAVNRLTDHVKHLTVRIDNLCKNPSLIAFDKYVDEPTACKILKISPDQIYKMRKNGDLEFIRYHRKILYPVESIHTYLDSQKVKPPLSDTG